MAKRRTNSMRYCKGCGKEGRNESGLCWDCVDNRQGMWPSNRESDYTERLDEMLESRPEFDVPAADRHGA